MTTYTKCDTLPLDRYIVCIVDKDLSALINAPDTVLQGETPKDYTLELKKVWLAIQAEYLSLSQSTMDVDMITTSLEIDAIGVKIELLGHVLELSQQYFSPLFVEIFKSYGVYVELDPSDQIQYLKNLNRISSKSKIFIVQYNDKLAQLKKMQSGKPDTKIDRMYFNTSISVLSKFMGYEIKESDTTVSKYISIMNLYSKHCEEINKLQNGRR